MTLLFIFSEEKENFSGKVNIIYSFYISLKTKQTKNKRQWEVKYLTPEHWGIKAAGAWTLDPWIMSAILASMSCDSAVELGVK